MKTTKTTYGIFKKTLLLAVAILSVSSAIAQTGGANYQAGPTMMRGKIFPTASLLDNGKVITFSGRETNFVSCSYSDMYDPVTNTFTESPMNFPHDGSATVKLSDGRYFLLGGSMDLGVAPGYSSTEMYNPTTNTFDTKASMTMARMQHAAIQLNNGNVLIVGAWYNNNGAQYGEVYDTAANTFVPTGALNDPRAQPLVFPTTDGGAIITGGWPSYSGAVKTTVEYYQTPTNDFVTQSSELIPADPGWLPLSAYTRPMTENKMSNGKYLLMAYRTMPTTEYALLVFDPTTKLFSKLTTSSPLRDSLTDGGFFDFALNKTANMAYLIGVDSGYDPQRVCVVTVNLSTGDIYHPTTTYTLPAQEYFYASYTYIPSVGKILVQGINGGNAGYFTGTDKTYLLTPQFTVGTNDISKTNDFQFIHYPNPAKDELKIEMNSTEASQYQIKIIDMLGRALIQENMYTYTPGIQKWTLNTNTLTPGIYKLFISDKKKVKTTSLLITK